jgi:hypothetical protein
MVRGSASGSATDERGSHDPGTLIDRPFAERFLTIIAKAFRQPRGNAERPLHAEPFKRRKGETESGDTA